MHSRDCGPASQVRSDPCHWARTSDHSGRASQCLQQTMFSLALVLRTDMLPPRLLIPSISRRSRCGLFPLRRVRLIPVDSPFEQLLRLCDLLQPPQDQTAAKYPTWPADERPKGSPKLWPELEGTAGVGNRGCSFLLRFLSVWPSSNSNCTSVRQQTNRPTCRRPLTGGTFCSKGIRHSRK